MFDSLPKVTYSQRNAVFNDIYWLEFTEEGLSRVIDKIGETNPALANTIRWVVEASIMGAVPGIERNPESLDIQRLKRCYTFYLLTLLKILDLAAFEDLMAKLYTENSSP